MIVVYTEVFYQNKCVSLTEKKRLLLYFTEN